MSGDKLLFVDEIVLKVALNTTKQTNFLLVGSCLLIVLVFCVVLFYFVCLRSVSGDCVCGLSTLQCLSLQSNI
jgi:hypothetical protein